MKNSAGRVPDVTAATAVSDVSGDLLLAAMRSRIENERDQVLILAHTALGVSLSRLASQFGLSRREVADRIDTIITRLTEDPEFASKLGDIRQAGRTEHYQALAFRIGLQDWFCACCGEFIAQPRTGRPRKTCSDYCRHKRWKRQQGDSATGTDTAPGQVQLPLDEAALHRKLHFLVPPIADYDLRRHPVNNDRVRALLLLGFRCPIQLSPSDLATLDVNDVSRTATGLEIMLYRRDARRRRYIILPADTDPRFCPLTAVFAWRKHLLSSGHTTGPLFIRISRGRIPDEPVRLTGDAIAKAMTSAARSTYWYYGGREGVSELTFSTLLPDYLYSLPGGRRLTSP